MSFMKTFRFKIRYDEEFQDYYFKPYSFGNKIEYLFGIQCVESPILEDFEFKIY